MTSCAVVLMLLPCFAHAEPAGRERLSLDPGWRFHLGDFEDVGRVVGGEPIAKWRWKADEQGEPGAPAMAAAGLDTSGPDWQDAAPGQDVFHGRVGFVWCRTTLPEVPGPHRTLYFEGVDDNATVYLNGTRLLHHEGWDEPFEVALGSAWREGGPDVLAVLVENTAGIGGVGPATLAGGQAEVDPGSAAGTRYDDKAWRVVDVPHDYVIEGTFDPKADDSHGFLPKSLAWYRKTFTLPEGDRGRRLWVEFDGIYRNSTIWFNGHRLGAHGSGYTSFYFDVTDLANCGGRNVLAVRVDPTRNEGWWYEGGGIYRHVWLTKLDPVHVDHWGTFVSADVPDPGDGRQAPAVVTVQTTLVNQSAAEAACTLRSEVQDAAGKSVASASSDEKVPAGGRRDVTHQAKLASATLWSLQSPALYQLVTTVLVGGKPVDRVVTPFGVRQVRFDADQGFLLNGKPVKIKGTCNHQDFAGVGVALPDRLHALKIEKLKAMGSNGYRCSHHPPAPELLDACDRLGMVVMDENRHLGESPEILDQVESMVRRDRNHPSIIMWSLCNEEGKQGTPEGEKMGRAMSEVVRRFDPTRPITAAMNGGYGSGLSNLVDLQGFNYNQQLYDSYHKDHPQKPLLGSETASTVTTRGLYQSDPVRGYVSCYTNGAEGSWRPVAERPFMAGGFVWTGFDYRGEPSPYAWPCINSHFGIMDTCGFPKDDYWYYLAWWSDQTVLHLAPHWNWGYRPGGGAEVDIRCYSNCERVELFVNGKSQGAKPMERFAHLEWRVKWEPGVLSAKGYRGDQVVATTEVQTTGDPVAVKLAVDRSQVSADGEDVALVTASVVDAQGRVVPVADNEVDFEVSPNARIIGVGNGDPSSHEPDKASSRRVFGGLCLAVIQANRQPGTIRVAAKSPRLQPASVEIEATPAPARPSMPAAR